MAVVNLEGELENLPYVDRAMSNPRWIDGKKLTYLVEDDRTQSLEGYCAAVNSDRSSITTLARGSHRPPLQR